MPLESLLTLVEKLRERIDDHGKDLRQSEALTRYALIDPLLRELGWDTEDPDLVIPEYNVSGGQVDYALLSDGKPIMMVEAKSLGTPLQDALEQGLRYCLIERTRYLSITDGGRWGIYYDTHKAGDPGKKRIVEFDLKNGPATEACLRALTLWNLRVSGQVAPEQTPVVEPTHRPSDSPGPSTPPPPPPSSDEQKWRPLSELEAQADSRLRSLVEVRFPDNSGVSVNSGWALLPAVVQWLVDGNYLTTSDCPIPVRPRSKICVVSSSPVNMNGRPFGNGGVQIGPVYLQRFSGHKGIKAARTIIEHIGQDPAQFKVRFSPP